MRWTDEGTSQLPPLVWLSLGPAWSRNTKPHPAEVGRGFAQPWARMVGSTCVHSPAASTYGILQLSGTEGAEGSPLGRTGLREGVMGGLQCTQCCIHELLVAIKI